jgi:HK97 family phage major capsid protein
MEIDEIKKALVERDTAIGNRLSNIEKMFKEQANLRERLEEIEASASAPRNFATGMSRADAEHCKRFDAWLRKPHDATTKQALENFEAAERKEVSIGSNPGGGFAVPEIIARDIENLEKKLSPVRRLVKIVQVGSSDYKELVNVRGGAAGWVGELGTRSETATPQLREITPTQGELYALPVCTEWSLDDLFFNVQNWLAENVALEFAVLEGDAVVRGNGVTKPTGMLNSAPTNVADQFPPSRAAGVLQYIPSGDAALVTADSLISLVFAVNSAYRANGSFAMNSATLAAVRKLKASGTGEYLYAPGLVAGQPDRLLGYPVEVWEQMDDVGANTFPIAFGDFRRGYLLVDRVGMRITPDAVTTPGKVRFYVRRREGGIVANNDSIKLLKISTT